MRGTSEARRCRAGRSGLLGRLLKPCYHQSAETLGLNPKVAQHLNSGRLAVAQQSRQEVVRRDPLGAKLVGLVHPLSERLLGIRRERNLSRPARVAFAEDLQDPLPHALDRQLNRHHHARCKALFLSNQPEQDVLAADAPSLTARCRRRRDDGSQGDNP